MLYAILAGRLLGAALACGLNLYATIATLGLAARLGWIDSLPPALRGLEHGLLIGGALFLLGLELIASAVRFGHSLWESAHTFVRPVGAAALAWLALESAPVGARLPATALAATVALTAHGMKLGLRVAAVRERWQRMAATAAEAAAASILTAAVLFQPAAALSAVVVIGVLVLALGAAPLRGAAFAARAVIARLRGFFGTRQWRGTGDLPRALRPLVTRSTIASGPPRAVRAALGNGRLRGAWRNGWLVLDDRGAGFLHRRLARPRRIPLDGVDAGPVRKGFLADVVVLTGQNARFTLHLLKDGPPAEATVGALRALRS